MTRYNIGLFESTTPEPDTNLCVVRVSTSFWSDNKGLHQKKDLIFLKRKCEGINLVSEDVSAIGVEWVFSRIINLHSVKDGIYEVATTNVQYDFESGYVDDYDYKLIPYNTDEG